MFLLSPEMYKYLKKANGKRKKVFYAYHISVLKIFNFIFIAWPEIMRHNQSRFTQNLTELKAVFRLTFLQQVISGRMILWWKYREK